MNREQQLVSVFVHLADTLTTEFEAIDLMQTLAETSRDVLPVEATGIALSDPRGRLRVLATTHPAAELLELFEIQNSEGPCYDCFQSATPIVNLSVEESWQRWPQFMACAADAGYTSAHAFPLRLRDEVIGVMNLFCTSSVELPEDDIGVAQGLCDIATIGLLQERAVREKHLIAEQLQAALNSRIQIEQAKGILSERLAVPLDEAFVMMRKHARANNLRLADAAAGVIQGQLVLPVEN
ncbi:MAG TPA: GAF and ANTAR domain-containing protein [Nocardioidaceae bacterium]|nr:GAF and ANTAR domain-containing protein [Nocardioidaceae bacterium]